MVLPFPLAQHQQVPGKLDSKERINLPKMSYMATWSNLDTELVATLESALR